MFSILLIIVITLNQRNQRNIKNLEEKLNNMNNVLSFQQKFSNELQELNNEKFYLKVEETKLRSDLLLLQFSKNIKINLLLLRISLLRKIINVLLTEIIENNSDSLRITEKKFIDILKPNINNNKFFIIYCKKEGIEDVKDYNVDIIIDFMMFIHNYTSEKIHFNKIQNKPEIFNTISNEQNSENSDIKTNASFNAYELIDYVFKEYDLEKETKKMIDILNKEMKENDITKSDIIKSEDGKENNIENGNKQENNNIGNKEQENNTENTNEQENNNIENKEEKKTQNEVRVDNNIQNGNRKRKNKNKRRKKKRTENGNRDIDNEKKIKEEEDNINIHKKPLESNNSKKEEDIDIKKTQNEVQNIPEKNFENFKSLFNENLDEEETEIIKNIYNKIDFSNHSLKENIKSLRNIKKDTSKILKKKIIYGENIINFKYENIEEYSIENMYEIYKLNFDMNSNIYSEFSQKQLSIHYRFNDSYSKLVNINKINSYNLSDMREDIKKLMKNNLINILLEDKGKFGSGLIKEDIN